MAEARTRVALLARAGAACERLQSALRDAGADLVLIADPLASTPQDLAAADVQTVLVALEPSVESALEAYESLFADPTLSVIFDEAELAAVRDGWDAARWVRHLAAKLHRHGDVLPHGAEVEPAFDIEAGRLGLYQRPDADGDLTGIADEAEGMAGAVPRDSLELVAKDEDTAIIQAQDNEAPAARARFQQDIDDLQQRIAHMELAETTRADGDATGAVVILAGIGGPDAVRQLLAGLPSGFPRAVLIQQRLDGARHDKLVRQMQRATKLPVELAGAGKPLVPGHVYILPTGFGVVAGDVGDCFAEDGGDVAFANLPAADTAVIMLSGSDPAVVDAAMTHSGHGALVAGQSPDGCYDAVAAQALITRGAETGGPAELARLLVARWPE